MQKIDQYLEENAQRFTDELLEFLRIPSISADSQYNDDVKKAANFVVSQFSQAGFESETIETPGHPIVFASRAEIEGAPTVLVYGHYDVQPADPLDEWKTPPFEPTIRGEHVFARGATDDKGQMLTHIKSVEAWEKVHGNLPVNVKFLIEGEEEVGSKNLETFIEQNKEKLDCDIAVISDTSQYAPEIPAITYALRGITACELTVKGPSQDLHSGVFGGSIANPVNALARMVAALQDENGRIQIPGFYDDVVALSEKEREAMAALPFDEANYLSNLGVSATFGEEGFTTLERRWARPTCDVNGIVGGYTGEGPKTIVPSWATVKISCRLVPNQNPEKISASLESFMKSKLSPGLEMEFVNYHGAPGLVFDFNSPSMEAAKAAIEKSFGKAPVMIREGGSIPVVGTFQQLLGVETLLLGWGQNTDNLHSPNEHFNLKDFQRGIRASAYLWKFLAEM